MLLVVHQHNSTHRQSFQPVDRLQNGALKPETAVRKFSKQQIKAVRIWTLSCLPGGPQWWFVAPSRCGSRATCRTAGLLCPEEAEKTPFSSARWSSSHGPTAGGKREGWEEEARKGRAFITELSVVVTQGRCKREERGEHYFLKLHVMFLCCLPFTFAVYSIYDQICCFSAGVHYLSVPMAFRKAPPHHVGHAEGFDSQQVKDHRVGQSELGLECGGLTLSQTKRMMSVKEKSVYN